MKMTLLELVQQIASKMSSDEVNSIGDTVESLQIANEVMVTYYSMIGNIEFPYQYNLIPLEPSGDTTKPTHMKVPTNVDNFKWIQYNNGTASEPDYKEVCYMAPEEFVAKTLKSGSNAITVQDYAGSYLTVYSDSHPKYYTMFDDVHLVFDSYDASVDDTLQASKVRAFGQTIPTWEMTDDFTPNLPAKHFPQLLAEAAESCSVNLKQSPSPIDQRRARQQYVRHFNNRNRKLGADDKIVDFGRR